MEFDARERTGLWLEGQEIETAFVGDNCNIAMEKDLPNPGVQEDLEKHVECSAHSSPTASQDGGYGWVVVAASFASTTISSIFVAGFSVLYEAIADYFKTGKGVTGWIGSLSLSVGGLLGKSLN